MGKAALKWFVNLDGIFERYPERLQKLLIQVGNRPQNVRVGTQCRVADGTFTPNSADGLCMNCGCSLEKHGRVFSFDIRRKTQTDLVSGRMYKMLHREDDATPLPTQLICDVLPSDSVCSSTDASEATHRKPLYARPERLDLVCGAPSNALSAARVWFLGQPQLIDLKTLQSIIARAGGVFNDRPTTGISALVIVRGADPFGDGLVNTHELKRVIDRSPACICVDETGFLKLIGGQYDSELQVWANDALSSDARTRIAMTLDPTPRGHAPLPTRLLRHVCTNELSTATQDIKKARVQTRAQKSTQLRWLELSGATPGVVHALNNVSSTQTPCDASKQDCLFCAVPLAMLRHSDLLTVECKTPSAVRCKAKLMKMYGTTDVFKTVVDAIIVGEGLTKLIDTNAGRLDASHLDAECAWWAERAGACVQLADMKSVASDVPIVEANSAESDLRMHGQPVTISKSQHHAIPPKVVTIRYDMTPLEGSERWWELEHETLHLEYMRENDTRHFIVTKPCDIHDIRRLCHSTRAVVRLPGETRLFRNRRLDETVRTRNVVELSRPSHSERVLCVQAGNTVCRLRLQVVHDDAQKDAAEMFATSTDDEIRARARAASKRGWTLTRAGLYDHYPSSAGVRIPLEALSSQE